MSTLNSCNHQYYLWRNCMYTWEHSDLEPTCKRFMDSWNKCKNDENSNGKNIILEKGPKKVVLFKVEQRKR